MNNIRIFSATLGGLVLAVIEPALPYCLLCTVMVIADTVTAWTLSRRVARRYPGRAAGAGAGKIQSRRLGRTIVTLLRVYALLVVASMADLVLFEPGQGSCLRFSAGAVCFWQAISVLENEASCSNRRWARMARRYLVDKVSRHLK